MADNTPPAAPSRPESNNETHGHKRARSPYSDGRNQSEKRGRGDRGRGDRGRGDRGRGRGRGDQSRGRGRGRDGGFGSNKSGGRYKKGDMGRGEYEFVTLILLSFYTTN
jgi:hypothetical protein